MVIMSQPRLNSIDIYMIDGFGLPMKDFQYAWRNMDLPGMNPGPVERMERAKNQDGRILKEI